MCTSKEKALRHYVDLIVTVCEENSKITQDGESAERQLWTSKSGMCLDENWMFVDSGEEGVEGPKFRLHSFAC